MTHIEIRAYHCDGFGHVNNARWLELFDEARWQFWQERDYAWFKNQQLAIVSSRIEIDYLRPAITGDRLSITSTWEAFESRAAWLTQTATRNGKLLASARVKLAVLGPDSPRALDLAGELLEKLQN